MLYSEKILNVENYRGKKKKTTNAAELKILHLIHSTLKRCQFSDILSSHNNYIKKKKCKLSNFFFKLFLFTKSFENFAI